MTRSRSTDAVRFSRKTASHRLPSLVAASLPLAALLLVAGQACAAPNEGADRPQADEASARKGVIGMVQAGLTPAVDNTLDTGLPDVDARVERGVGLLVLPGQQAPIWPRTPGYVRDLARLTAQVPGLAIDSDQFTGSPRFVRSTYATLTGPSPASARDVLYRFARDYRDLVGFNADEILTNRYDRDFITEHNGVHHLTVIQQHNGVDILNADLRANVTARGELLNISTTLLDRPEGGFVIEEPRLTDEAAIYAAAAYCGIPILDELTPADQPTGPNAARSWKTPAALRANDPLQTAFVYFALDASTVRPAWTVSIAAKGIGHTYDVVIDAVDGTLLSRQNRLRYFQTQSASFRVYTTQNPNPGPTTLTPNGTQYPAASRTLVTVNPADNIVASPLGWIPDGATETLGNNVDGHTDTNADNVADTPRPNGGASRIFDFAMDTTAAPSAYSAASVTQLFYWANVYHDRLYPFGFNEAAGNFQNDNLGRGGVAGDRVQADAQDGSGTNNANFSTAGTDGSAARVQMYIFTGPTPDRDGSFDRDVVFHELTHGTSIRLHRGLNATQSNGMGEGWSDFFAILLGATASDDPTLPIASGAYASYQLAGNVNNNYWGIRRYPYCTNLNINPLTFKSIDPNQAVFPANIPRSTITSTSASEVHNVGEIWCTMLNECRAGLIAANGFAGNDLMIRLTLDGMKLSPTSPTFIQSRDAILQADLAYTGGANAGTLWRAFAKRGIGNNAAGPANTTTTGVTESYTTPQYVTFAVPSGTPSVIAPGATFPMTVSAAPFNLTITPNSGTLSYKVNSGATTTVNMTETSPGEYSTSLPALNCFDRIDYWFTVGTSVGNFTSPASAPTAVYSASVLTDTSTLFTDDFQTNKSWTVGPNTATAGLWTRGVPIGTAAQPSGGRTGAGTNCFFTGQGTVGGALGEADVDGGYTTLTSPVLDLSGRSDATVSYYRWYSNGTGSSPYADVFTVDVSVDGGSTWTRAETIGPGSAIDNNVLPRWNLASWSFSSLGLTPTAQVKVRFIADDAGAGSIIEAAIDDFLVTARGCTPPTPPSTACSIADVAPPGGDGTVDGTDFVAFINSFALGDIAADPLADIAGGGTNGLSPDGNIDGTDFVAFINAFAIGC